MNQLTVAGAVQRLNRSEQLVRRWLREGRLRGEKLGRDWFITERELRRFEREQPERRKPRR